MNPVLRDAVVKMVPYGSRVLDLGCGDGAMLAYLQQHRLRLELQFHFKNPASPKDVGGVPGDDRKLGMGLISAQFQ